MNAEAARRGDVRTIDVLGALSLAADMALGVRSGHGVRATYIGMHIADELGVPPEQRVDLFYAELLMDAGCTAWTSQMAATILGNDIVARRELFFADDPSEPRELLRWLAGYMATGERLDTRLRRSIDFALHGKEFMLEGLRNTADTASRMARRLGTSIGVQEGLRFVFEQWNGHGPYGRRTAEIPLVSRIVFATIFLEVFHQLGGREAAVALARGRRGKTLDPQVVDAFLKVASLPDFWTGLEDDAVWARVRQLEPDPHTGILAPSMSRMPPELLPTLPISRASIPPGIRGAWRRLPSASQSASPSRRTSSRPSASRGWCTTWVWWPCRRSSSTSPWPAGQRWTGRACACTRTTPSASWHVFPRSPR